MKLSSVVISIALGITIGSILVSLPAYAVDVKLVPNPRPSGVWVTDMSNILSPATEAQINQMISELERKNGTEIAVVTVPETTPYSSPKEFTTTLFNYWKVGKVGADNGVIFMISVSDRRVEIETGYGVEGILPDAKVGNIVSQKIIPEFKQGNFEQGILDGTKTLVFELSPADFPLQKFAIRNKNWFINSGLIGLSVSGLYLLGIGTHKFANRRRYVQPQGRSHCISLSRPVYCQQCKKPMKRVVEDLLYAQLTEVEKFAKDKKYIDLIGWQCPSCQTSESLNYHILFTTTYSHSQCPKCKGWTMRKDNQVILPPTYVNAGRRLISKTCEYCDYHKGKTRIILPKLVEVLFSSSGSSSSGSSGGSSSGSGRSGGGGFGGGSSGGGGAGGSW